MRKIKVIISSASIFLLANIAAIGQEKELGDKEYLIVKDYKPVLAESSKISDTPEGDTTSSTPQKMDYNLAPKKLETNFEAGVIRAVKIKDEPISKLYNTLVKLGLGNYTTYYGELFYNTLRSKTSQFGVHLNHLSGDPTLNENNAAFSNNTAELNGKYFLDNATFSGNFGFDRKVVHYYGLPSDTIVNADDTKQRFNNINFALGLKSNWLNKDHLDYDANFEYHSTADLFDVMENNFLLKGGLGEMIGENYFGVLTAFDFFKKTDANFEKLDLNSDLSRNIIVLNPYMLMDKDRVHLKLGFNFSLEKNLGNTAHLYPDISVSIPIAENILAIYADVTGNLQKTNFRTLTNENPFTSSAVKLTKNQSNDLIIDGGLKGNFSGNVSFNAMVKYNKVSSMVLFYNDSVQPNKFNVLYDDGNVLNLHAEINYRNNGKLNLGLSFDQYNYKMERQARAWHKPANETKLYAKYNLQNKIIANATLFFRGTQYGLGIDTVTHQNSEIKISGYADINLGLEYRYSKILSFYANLNNLGFAKYEQWYNYPSERFNILGGLTYSF